MRPDLFLSELHDLLDKHDLILTEPLQLHYVPPEQGVMTVGDNVVAIGDMVKLELSLKVGARVVDWTHVSDDNRRLPEVAK